MSASPAQVDSSRFIVPVVCFVVAMVDGYDTLMLSFLAPLIAKDWGLSPPAVGALFASTYAGAALGATVVGTAADRFGRKAMLLVSLAIAGLCTLASVWSIGPGELMVWRGLAGVGLGGAIPTISALAAAHTPVARRTTVVARTFLGYPVGALVGGMATAAAMAALGWRGVMAFGGAFACLTLPLVFFLVREDSGLEVRALRAVHSRRPLADLLADGRGAGTVLLCAATFLTLLMSYFLVSWTPTVLTFNGMNPQRAAASGAVLNLGGLVGAWTLSAIIGRRSPSAAIAVCLAAGAVVVALLGLTVAGLGTSSLALVFAVGLLVIGAQSNLPALCIHFYPPPVYATGVGLAMAVGRLGSIAGPLIGGYLVSRQLGWERLFLIAAAPAALAALGLGALSVRTRAR